MPAASDEEVQVLLLLPRALPHHDGGRDGAAATTRRCAPCSCGRAARALLPARREMVGHARDPGAEPARRALRVPVRARRPDLSRRRACSPRLEDAGKLMALAAYGDPRDAEPEIVDTVDRIATSPSVLHPAPKGEFRDSPVYNAGVESQADEGRGGRCSPSASSRSSPTPRREQLPAGIPLYISGGCGLNCDWNMRVARARATSRRCSFRPARTTRGRRSARRIDALARRPATRTSTGTSTAASSSSGTPSRTRDRWERRELRPRRARRRARRRAHRRLGPGPLGDRAARARQPLAPGRAVRAAHARPPERDQAARGLPPDRAVLPARGRRQASSTRDFEDPYMLYFRHASAPELGAVTHVDGSARVQTVTRGHERRGCTSCCPRSAARTASGVLCNTSLNFKGFGFINRMSDLVEYCEARGIDDMVVDGSLVPVHAGGDTGHAAVRGVGARGGRDGARRAWVAQRATLPRRLRSRRRPRGRGTGRHPPRSASSGSASGSIISGSSGGLDDCASPRLARRSSHDQDRIRSAPSLHER